MNNPFLTLQICVFVVTLTFTVIGKLTNKPVMQYASAAVSFLNLVFAVIFAFVGVTFDILK